MTQLLFNFECVSNQARIDSLIGWAAQLYGIQSWAVSVTRMHVQNGPSYYYFRVTCTDSDPAILGCMELLLTGLFRPREYHCAEKGKMLMDQWLGISMDTHTIRGGTP